MKSQTFLHIILILSFFQTVYAQPNNELNIRMLEAADKGQADSVKYWINRGADVNYEDDNGFTALTCVISNGRNELLNDLVLNKANVNHINKDGQTPLMIAATLGNVHACKYLIDSGSNILTQNKNGENAIQLAENNGYIRVANFFKNPETYSSDSTYMQYRSKCFEFIKSENFEQFYKYAVIALNKAKSELSKNHKEALEIRDLIIAICFYFEKYDTAEKQLIELLEIENTTGDLDNYADNLLILSSIYEIKGNSKADTLAAQAINIINSDFKEKLFYKITLFNISISTYTEIEDYVYAEQYLNMLLQLKKGISGENNSYYIESLIGLADFYRFINKSHKEEFVLSKIISIKKKYPTLKIPDFSSKVVRLKLLYELSGKYKDANRLIEDDSVYSSFEKKESFTTTINSWNEFIGLTDKTLNNHINSLNTIKSTLNTTKAIYGKNSAEYAIWLTILGNWYKSMGQYDNAQDPYWEALNIRESVFGKEHIEYGKALLTLAQLYLPSNENIIAENLLYEYLAVIEKNQGEDSEIYGFALSNLAGLYHQQNKIDSAIYIYTKAYDILTSKLDKNDKRILDIICEMAFILMNQGINLEEAEAIFKLKLENQKDSLDYNEKRILHNRLIMLYDIKGSFIDAKPHLLKSSEITFKLLNEALYNLSSEDRKFYLNIINDNFNYYQSIFFRYYSEFASIATNAYNNELLLKGILLNTSKEVELIILNTNDSMIIQTWKQMKSIRKRISFLKSQAKENQSKFSDLEEEANQLDKFLTQKSQEYRQSQYELQIDWQDVQNKLKEDEATIEFISFPYFNRQWTDSTLYCALVLKKDMEHPEMIPLFEQKQLDSLWVGGNLEANYLYASRGVETIVNNNHVPNGKKLYNLVWKPLEKSLEDVHTVYYAPSGNLHQVAFAALPVDSSTYLCDRFNLVQLSSTRQLATSEWQTGEKDITSAVLFGGIKYDLEEQELAQLKQSLPPKEETILNEFRIDSTLRSGGHTFLEGTKTEIDSIAYTLQTGNISAAVYSGISASEESFKALTDQDIGILHIATHGFFFPDEKIEYEERERFMLFGEQRFRKASNPLLRSGLILAGGNRVWKGEEPVPGMEDGILTAQEISEMYLPNTELVVLSACETGLGEIQGGEGVFGLQRAFKLAGVKTILMSLWKVPDNETSELMQAFYKKWLSGMDKHTAFRSAQLELRHKYPHEPKKWAGFVMVD